MFILFKVKWIINITLWTVIHLRPPRHYRQIFQIHFKTFIKLTEVAVQTSFNQLLNKQIIINWPIVSTYSK
jgi:hypothetical protein